MDFIFGMCVGWLTLYFGLVLLKHLKQKKGIKSSEYEKLALTTRLKDTVRHIVFEYNIKRRNNDFLLNIKFKTDIIMQIMHRAHFPELGESEDDIGFGLALYIPAVNLNSEQVSRLSEIIRQEVEVLKEVKIGPVEYYLIDLGVRVRFTGYFLSRIVKEVFKYDHRSADFSFELFSEGALPYFRKNGLRISLN